MTQEGSKPFPGIYMENRENTALPVSDGQTPEIATLGGSGGVVAEIGWIRFPRTGKQALAGAMDHPFNSGDVLLVRTERGDIHVRAMTSSSRRVFIPSEFFEVVRVLSPADGAEALKKDTTREHEARRVFVELVRKHELEMHLSEVEVTHGDSRIVFNFTSPGRVDFRSLVRELAGALKSRIELRQIGVRDEARCTGGLGSCGLPLCCATFLREFTTVTIRMAKVQGLVPNPQKVSGLCGRLMCCLAYEHGVYADLMKNFPKTGSQVLTPKGEGRVKEVLVMRNAVKVALGPGVIEEFRLDQLGVNAGDAGSDVVDDEQDETASGEDGAAEDGVAREPRPRQGRGQGPVGANNIRPSAQGQERRQGRERGQGQGPVGANNIRPSGQGREQGQASRPSGQDHPHERGGEHGRHVRHERRPQDDNGSN